MTSTYEDRTLLATDVAIKAPCRAATTANITLSGLQTVDGIVLVAGDRVLVKNQTSGATNGIYLASTGAWTRTADADGNRDIVDGTLVLVRLGTASALALYECSCTTSPAVIGTTSLTFNLVSVVVGNAGSFTTLTASGQITSSLATGTAPLVIASTTKVANLNVDLLDGTDWRAPGPIGGTTPDAGSFTTVTTTGTATFGSLIDASGATAGQVKFPATQNASADANTLDDYEEGSWTPSVGGTANYNVQIGRYTKIGRMVYIFMDLRIGILGTGNTTTVSGLPFAVNASFNGSVLVSNSTNLATAVVSLNGEPSAGASTIVFRSRTAANAAHGGSAIFGDGAVVLGSGLYMV